MKKLAWHIGKVLENWGIEIQAWADPHRVTRETDETVKQVCLQNIELVKQHVQQGIITEQEGEERINNYLNSYNQISSKLWQNELNSKT